MPEIHGTRADATAFAGGGDDARIDVVLLARCEIGAGLGHVVRCVSVAEAAAALGLRSCVVIEDQALVPGPVARRVERSRGVSLRAVSGAGRGAAVALLLDEVAPTCVVLDDSTLPLALEGSLRACGAFVVVLDGSAERVRDADLVVDSTYSADPERKWSGMIDAGTVLLAGPRYAPIDMRLADLLDARVDASADPPLRVAVCLGGDDYALGVAEILAGLAEASAAGAVGRVDLIVGALWAPTFAVESVVPPAGALDVRIHLDPQEAMELIAAADLAVGATGMMAWERAFLGVPSLTVSVVEHQEGIARELAGTGAIFHLGPIADLRSSSVARAVIALAEEPERRDAMRDAARALFAGSRETGALTLARVLAERCAHSHPARPDGVQR